MTLHIGVDRMTCEGSPHVAWRVSGPDAPQRWRVSWLPDRRLTRNEAISAMSLVEALAPSGHPDRDNSAAVAGWACELGLTPAAVIDYLNGRSQR